MSFTMQDFLRQFWAEHAGERTPEQRRALLESLPPEERLAGLSPEQIQEYLDKLTTSRKGRPRKPRNKSKAGLTETRWYHN